MSVFVNKEMPNHFHNEDEIRMAISGYWSLRPLHLDNYFYDSFKRSWNNFFNDFQKFQAFESEASYYTIMATTTTERNELYGRCCQELENIKDFIETFILNLQRFSKNIEANKHSKIKAIIESWKQNKDTLQFAQISIWTRNLLFFADFSDDPIEKPWGNLHFYISKSLQLFDQRVKMLASYYARYWGLDRAKACVINHGRLKKCDEYINDPFPYSQFTIDKIADKKIQILLSFGHLLDTAIKLRFLSLTSNKNKSQVEAYDEIVSELEDLGYDPASKLPDEPKSLGDRARRHREKQFEQLSSLSNS